MIAHYRMARQVRLLAAGALEGPARERARAHLARCRACRDELAELEAVLGLLARDPLREVPHPPISAEALVTRVRARLAARAQPTRARNRTGTGFWPAVAAAALVLLTLRPTSGPSPAPQPEAGSGTDAFLARMEHQLVREQAAHYLNEAQDVLVQVASSRTNCDRESERLDLDAESRRSRELLARRALLVDIDRHSVASARPVLEDVDQLLQEVATLPSCARSRDVKLIQGEIERRGLLMKISLMSRELAG